MPDKYLSLSIYTIRVRSTRLMPNELCQCSRCVPTVAAAQGTSLSFGVSSLCDFSSFHLSKCARHTSSALCALLHLYSIHTNIVYLWIYIHQALEFVLAKWWSQLNLFCVQKRTMYSVRAGDVSSFRAHNHSVCKQIKNVNSWNNKPMTTTNECKERKVNMPMQERQREEENRSCPQTNDEKKSMNSSLPVAIDDKTDFIQNAFILQYLFFRSLSLSGSPSSVSF